jgi:hypothetical protein
MEAPYRDIDLIILKLMYDIRGKSQSVARSLLKFSLYRKLIVSAILEGIQDEYAK